MNKFVIGLTILILLLSQGCNPPQRKIMPNDLGPSGVDQRHPGQPEEAGQRDGELREQNKAQNR